MTVNKSDGSNLITTYDRPGDYLPGNGSSFAEQMLSDDVITPVIEQRTLISRNGTLRLISGTFTNYQKYNSSYWRPNMVYQLEAPAPLSDLTRSSFSSAGVPVIHPNYKPAAYFDKYDQASGVLLSRHLADGAPESYFWGYNNQYPIAKVAGADYDAAKQFVDVALLNNPATSQGQLQTELNKLRTADGIKNALVTTFTFSPLVGMTSTRDAKGETTIYDFDEFQRLINIRDKDGNITKHTDYHYLGQ
ncbi:MAG: hypothetical protein AAGC65_22170 [Mucilaginibacter sp.]|uniref:hypothetical protein n=1 Tax=Mucilaginibacter sp. TaxID=1882438 RepID=UPI0031B4FF7A